MWSTPFDPAQRTVWIDVLVVGPLGPKRCSFVLDTASPVTILDPGIADELAYTPSSGKAIRSFWSVGGAQRGYALDVERFETMGFTVAPCEVLCQDLPREMGVDGLLGMDLLAGRIVTIDGIAGTVTLGP